MKPNFLLPYSVLLLRDGGDENYQKVKNLLAKIQRSPELSKDERSQLLMNYAVADWKLGNRDKAVKLLESAHRDHPCGLTYETLGFLYVEMGDAEQALSFNNEAYEYDDEDSVTLDNLASCITACWMIRIRQRCILIWLMKKNPAKSIPSGFSPAMIWRQGIPRRRLTSWKRHWKAAFLR